MTDALVPPVIWEKRGEMSGAGFDAVIAVGADWVFLPACARGARSRPRAGERGPVDRKAPASFRSAEPLTASSIESLPGDMPALDHLMDALLPPMSEAERQRGWSSFSAHVPEPPKPRGG